MAWTPGIVEIVVIGLVALLIFGQRLPQVMRSLGKSIVEFKKGVQGIEDGVGSAVSMAKSQVSDALGASDTQDGLATGDGETVAGPQGDRQQTVRGGPGHAGPVRPNC